MFGRLEFVISRSPVQAGSPAPILATTYGRSVGTLISSIVVTFVLCAGPAVAQEAPQFDWKPIVAAAAGASFDTISTHRFTSNGSGCVEGTEVFTRPPFTPAQPDFRRMWTYNAIGIAGVATVNGLAHVVRKRHPNAGAAKALSWLAKGYAYGLGSWRGFAGARNVRECGW